MDKDIIRNIINDFLIKQVWEHETTKIKKSDITKVNICEITIKHNDTTSTRFSSSGFNIEPLVQVLEQRFQDRIDEINEIHNERVDDLMENCKGAGS